MYLELQAAKAEDPEIIKTDSINRLHPEDSTNCTPFFAVHSLFPLSASCAALLFLTSISVLSTHAILSSLNSFIPAAAYRVTLGLGHGHGHADSAQTSDGISYRIP